MTRREIEITIKIRNKTNTGWAVEKKFNQEIELED